jgi:predicted transcriptional regulator
MAITRTRKFSPATIALAMTGATQTAIAAELGMTQATVSRTLHGQQAPTERFREALVRLVGEDAATTVMAAIPRQEVAA